MEPDDLARIDNLIGSGVPYEAVAFYGRWWQLERWLREFVYVELRAKYGARWKAQLPAAARQRAERDLRNEYMASADADDLLAYVDASVLFQVIEEEWDLFSVCLLPRKRWDGVADVLRDLRNRSAHCRRPHVDDLPRLEQTLRDLEPGAWRFYASFASEARVTKHSGYELGSAWVDGDHDDAKRLLRHAENNYETRFELAESFRPWSQTPAPKEDVAEGRIWKASWFIGARDLDPQRLVRELAERGNVTELLIYLELSSSHVVASFSGADSAVAVADAIGTIFDSILVTSHPFRVHDDLEQSLETWKRETRGLPSWVQVDSAFTLADPWNPQAFTIFAA